MQLLSKTNGILGKLSPKGYLLIIESRLKLLLLLKPYQGISCRQLQSLVLLNMHSEPRYVFNLNSLSNDHLSLLIFILQLNFEEHESLISFQSDIVLLTSEGQQSLRVGNGVLHAYSN